MPLSDWRDGADHADAQWGSIHNLDYLKANIAGGEGYDWFYASAYDRAVQNRHPIIDDSDWQEHWIWRTKDLRGWWENDHHERVGGVRSPDPTAWEPRSKPIWFTEYGVAAIDRGSNQPNLFWDKKSSESALPHFSRGWRDDRIQMQYYRAMGEFWADSANNPISELYGGPMVDMARAHGWAWDARPYPWFPGNRDLWQDGDNWARGHWLTGRATGQPLDALIAEICARAGVTAVDVSRVYGVVRGFAVPSTDSARAALQSLMLAYGVEAAERDGQLVFCMRDGRAVADIAQDRLVARQGGDLALVRAAQSELTGRVRLGYVAEDAGYELRLAEAAYPDADDAPAASADLPLVLGPAEAQLTAQRWLAEARLAQDSARFALPPSAQLGAGDVVRLEGAGAALAGLWRIDRLTLAGAREAEATRVEPVPYEEGEAYRDAIVLSGYEAPPPVQPVFLDLPLWSGAERPHAPWLALRAQPWPGAVVVHRHGAGGAFDLAAMIGTPARLGVTETALAAAPAGLWDRGPALHLRMLSGQLSAATQDEVLAGANLMAIGMGGEWELLQFAEADLIGPDTYALRMRLRGQQGSDGVMALNWPAGAVAVMLDARLEQLPLALDALGLAQSYRVGPASRPLSDPSHRDHAAVFAGVGLRPYRPTHLRAVSLPNGDLAVSWIRRSRQGGDGWGSVEVPLAEAYERYLLRILQGGQVLRAVTLEAPGYIYAAADQAADEAGAAVLVEVAQISDMVGPGPFAQIEASL